jgi:predicted ATPase
MHITQLTLLHDQYPTHELYPFNIPLLNATDSIDLSGPVTFFVGENGSGKSTLLRAIAHYCGIHIWKNADRRRITNNVHEDRLHYFIDLKWADAPVPGSFFASEIFHDFAEMLDEWAVADPGMLRHYGRESLLTKSHGQSHMQYFKNRFTIKGIYLLDEPETALSPRRQIELLRVLKDIEAGAMSQFIIATHSPILLAYPGAKIYSFDHNCITQLAYEETDHYRLYKHFLTDRDEYLRANAIIK